MSQDNGKDRDGIARDRIDQLVRRIDRMEENLNRRFEGFPQEYGTSLEVEQLRASVETIRADHVQRREIDEVKTQLLVAQENVRKRLDEGTGRRTAYTLLGGVLATTLAIAFAVTQQNQLTHQDVSNQIAAESPWASDKPVVTDKLQTLELQIERLQEQVAQIMSLDKFFCQTRAKLLPPC